MFTNIIHWHDGRERERERDRCEREETQQGLKYKLEAGLELQGLSFRIRSQVYGHWWSFSVSWGCWESNPLWLPVPSPALLMTPCLAPLALKGTRAYLHSSLRASHGRTNPVLSMGAHQDCFLVAMMMSMKQVKDLGQKSWVQVLVLATGPGTSPSLACNIRTIPPTAPPCYCEDYIRRHAGKCEAPQQRARLTCL